jgi:hypothetical protein
MHHDPDGKAMITPRGIVSLTESSTFHSTKLDICDDDLRSQWARYSPSHMMVIKQLDGLGENLPEARGVQITLALVAARGRSGAQSTHLRLHPGNRHWNGKEEPGGCESQVSCTGLRCRPA